LVPLAFSRLCSRNKSLCHNPCWENKEEFKKKKEEKIDDRMTNRTDRNKFHWFD